VCVRCVFVFVCACACVGWIVGCLCMHIVAIAMLIIFVLALICSVSGIVSVGEL
jgi:hypothetical protein